MIQCFRSVMNPSLFFVARHTRDGDTRSEQGHQLCLNPPCLPIKHDHMNPRKKMAFTRMLKSRGVYLPGLSNWGCWNSFDLPSVSNRSVRAPKVDCPPPIFAIGVESGGSRTGNPRNTNPLFFVHLCQIGVVRALKIRCPRPLARASKVK